MAMEKFEYLVGVFISNYQPQLTTSQFNLFVHNSIVEFWKLVTSKVPNGFLSIDAELELPYLRFRIVSEKDLSLSLTMIESFAHSACNTTYEEIMKATPTMPISISFRRP